jgi:uncharacterized protein YbaR (Trm112 family)
MKLDEMPLAHVGRERNTNAVTEIHEMALESKAFELLACPCPHHGKLVQTGDGLRSLCCATHFDVIDGIPVLMLPEAKTGETR